MEIINTGSIIHQRVSDDGINRVAVSVDLRELFQDILRSNNLDTSIESANAIVNIDGEQHLVNIFNIGKASINELIS